MIPFPAKKYNVIYADPPWAFRVWSEKGKERSADKHYSCMTLDDLKQMPVNSITAGDGCALFMWATMPKLQEALDTIRAWGFKYKTCAFCWVKQNPKRGGGVRWSGPVGARQRGALPPRYEGPPAPHKQKRPTNRRSAARAA